MIRGWIAISLLAGSWMFGLGYFYPANLWIWLLLVASSTVLLSGYFKKLPDTRDTIIALALLLPAVIFVPWPWGIIPLMIVLGLAINLFPLSDERIKLLAQGALAAGVIMLGQSLAPLLYTTETAHSHELPFPLPDLLAGLANLLGIDAAADGSKIVMHSMRQVHRLGATWELLLDPVTFCFFIGGVVLLGLMVWNEMPAGRRWSTWIRSLRIFTLIITCWLPIRAGLLIAIYTYRILRAEPDRALYVMNHFFAPWPLLILLAVPVLLVWRFLRISNTEPSLSHKSPLRAPTEGWSGEGKGEGISDKSNLPRISPEIGSNSPGKSQNACRHYFFSIILIALATASFTAAVVWNPIGKRLGGRVKVVERHSTWEPTTRPYDTTWYGEPSGYNYAAIYDYLGQYYQMSRLLETDKIDDQTLGQCDVLVIKTPTARYTPAEVAAVDRFVRQGGGLLLIGDHTNFMRCATIMNDITRSMGFIFRDDLLFSNEPSAYDQHFELPWTPHPSLQYMPPMDFAVSCSIDPGFSHGRSVILSTGLWNMPPEYHRDNYHPTAQYCADMRYGAFIQLWAAWCGQGRAMAFTDSTIFSNFATFQPGKAELMLGMIEWLNRANPPLDPRPWLMLLGAALLCTGLLLAYQGSVSWLLLLAAGICAWTLTSEGVAAIHRWSMPLPKIHKPLPRVIIDRTTSNVPLSNGAFYPGNKSGYGMLEQWIARLGYYTIRQQGPGAFSGDALIVICPDRPVDAGFREQLEHYVAEGGKLLVFDTPENVNSTANSLLLPFGLNIKRRQAWEGTLSLADNWPGTAVSWACDVAGGRAVAQLGDRPVAALVQHGKGTVMAVGFASVFNDLNMAGEEIWLADPNPAVWMIEPDELMRLRYEALYALVRLLVENSPITPPAVGEATISTDRGKSKIPLKLPDLPMQELGPQE